MQLAARMAVVLLLIAGPVHRGWCAGFRLSIYPWESQGYFGYAC